MSAPRQFSCGSENYTTNIPMDDADWDLHAVVRGCSTANASVRAAKNDSFVGFSPDLFQISPNLENDKSSFQGLYEIYRSFCVDSPPVERGLQTPTPQTGILNDPPLGSSSTINPNGSNPQSKRRKNEEMRMVHEMTQEEVCADSWSWRKYGQKPIKGSLYPRNYYRCSTLKDCTAKKQVERSPNDPSLFLVSYTGEHTHQRPFYLRSLSGGGGSARSKLSQEEDRGRDCGGGLLLLHKGPCIPSLSPVYGSSISPAEEVIDAGGLMAGEEPLLKRFQDSDYSN